MSKITENLIGKFCIVRADKAGVFFGKLVAKEEQTVELTDCRKLFYWEEACAVEQLALDGSKSSKNKFTVTINQSVIENVIQIIPCTNDAIFNIQSIPEWKK